MPHLIGPDFIGIQTEDLDAARTFYTEVVGLKVAAGSPPGAVVFETKPVPFAVRKPLVDLKETDRLGLGVAIWFGCDDADALHDHLVEHGTPIVFAPKDGPFGRYFAFRDPFGYTITPHTVAHPQHPAHVSGAI
ncbi:MULTISPECIES: VOC family protein [unclassified Bradyrhizobium]|uniref:VOC family protein n=1 Tax=unclassified Bradyrhizobium TaxID=2631580 RepID=UPI0005D2218A|nr:MULTISPECIES: VOC family protein [unclassified Bradyrhizobium]